MVAGSKSKNLILMFEHGFNVPPLIAVPSKINDKDVFYNQISHVIPPAKLYAVRSSSVNEDTSENSMAGHFYSALAISYEQLYDEYLNVVASFKGSGGDVIIQEFIPSDKSGVLFTNAGDNKAVINANFGLCKTVVDGLACDEYIIEEDGSINAHIAPLKQTLILHDGALTNTEITDKRVFQEEEIVEILAAGKKIEQFFNNVPQDIEFCYYNNALYILQSRPVTRKIFESTVKTLYDNANIAESYSGLVLPLTFTFARQIYKTVYINLLTASGVNSKNIHKHIDIFDNLLKSFYGRMYYNMTNWYLMMAFAPGYERNKKNLESMISSNIQENIMRTIRPSLLLKITYPFILIYKVLFINKTVKKFIHKTRLFIESYRQTAIQQLSYDECVTHYNKLSKNLLEQWHIPVENDFMVMTYFGILRKRMSDSELQKYINFNNISVQQIDALRDLALALCENTDIYKAVTDKDVITFNFLINQNTQLKAQYTRYFNTYGGRFGNELKLESADIEEDASKLFALISAYKNAHYTAQQLSHTEKHPAFLDRYFIKKFIFYASQREELRLLRSNCFSIVRKLFNRMADILYTEGVLESPQDIYYIELEDVLGKNIASKEDIVQIKKTYESFKHVEPQSHFAISDNEAPPLKANSQTDMKIIQGRSCTPGVITGKIRVFKEYHIPDAIDFDIIVAKHTDPGWTTLIGLSKGLIIEHGGVLSHAAIVSRELGIPTVIGVENATALFETGSTVKINGSNGLIEIIE